MAKPQGRHLRWRVKVTSPLEPSELLRETGWRSRQTAAGCGLPSTLQDSLLSPGQCKHRSSPPWPLELSLPNHHCLGQEGRPHSAPLGQGAASLGVSLERRPSPALLRLLPALWGWEIALWENKHHSGEGRWRLTARSVRKRVGHHPLL